MTGSRSRRRSRTCLASWNIFRLSDLSYLAPLLRGIVFISKTAPLTWKQLERSVGPDAFRMGAEEVSAELLRDVAPDVAQKLDPTKMLLLSL